MMVSETKGVPLEEIERELGIAHAADRELLNDDGADPDNPFRTPGA